MATDLLLVFVTVLTAFFSTTASFITWRSSRGILSGPGLWFASFCCFSASVFVAVFTTAWIPLSLNQALANSLEALGGFLQFAGVLRFMKIGAPGVKRLTGLILLFLLTLSTGVVLSDPLSPVPAMIETLINFILSLTVSVILAVRSRRIQHAHRRFALGVFMFMTTAMGLLFLGNFLPVIGFDSSAFGDDAVTAILAGRWRFFGPLYWILFMSIVVFAENQLVNGSMLHKIRNSVDRLARSESELREANTDLHQSQKEFLTTLAEVMENRSQETAWHVVRVAEYSRILVENLNIDAETARLIVEASPLHDIGKTSVPDYVLNKRGLLSGDERELMRTHTSLGRSILMNSNRPLFQMAAVIAHEHHEQWDGSGYPEGKAGTAISLAGRIVALADSFDALTTKRIYKPAWTLSETLDYIGAKRAQRFDPALVDILFARIPQFREVMEKYSAD